MADEKSLSQEAWEIAKTLLAAGAIALVLRIVVFQPNTIPSSSMEPGVRTGDYLLITKWDYGWSRHSVPFSPPLPAGRVFARSPARGEVVVFKHPATGELYIKRVIGLPGDRVELRGGQVVLNGRPLPRTPLGLTEDPEAPGVVVREVREATPGGRSYLTYDRGAGYRGDDLATFVVPEGRYLMMGDNRDNSLDGRWPTSEGGVGLVPADNLVGRARYVLVSWRAGASVLKPWTWLDVVPERFFRRLR